MHQPPLTIAASPVSASPPATTTHRNRLAIAHLLLWTATTGIALAYLQTQKPPRPEGIHFSSILTVPGQDSKVVLKEMQLKTWKQWQTQYTVGLIAAPIYGAALAGGVLAGWRVLSRRFGFPVHPGHWLLLAIAGWALLFAAHPLIRSLLPVSPDGADFVWVTAMSSVVLACTTVIREQWRLPFGLAAAGLLILELAYVVGFCWSSHEPPLLFGLGLLAIAGVPFAALLCTVLDLAERGRYDTWHWIGVATLFGVVTHFTADWAVGQYYLH